jgi:hypothetical protein
MDGCKDMNCIVCGEQMGPYFNKRFDEYDLGVVNYYRCGNCGFCASKQHMDMSANDLARLNTAWHTVNNSRGDNPYHRHERHFSQSLMIHLLKKSGLVPEGEILDYGAGDGGVAKNAALYFGIKILCYDPYIISTINPVEGGVSTRYYGMVLCSAVFEHLVSRETLDSIERLVRPDGVLAIHTFVKGMIPVDPNWFYLLPVHSIFFTNRSMELLMEQWGYTSSLYNPSAKLWIWYRSDIEEVRRLADCCNALIGWKYLYFKKGFMDYWS